MMPGRHSSGARLAPDVRVVEVACYRVPTPYDTGTYGMSGGRRYTGFTSTIVKVTADDGTCGFGEASTMGGDYLDGFLESTEVTVRRLAPSVFTTDPLQATELVRIMDRELIGHRPGKAAIDIAMWDLRARLLGVPVGSLLGGIAQSSLEAFGVLPVGSMDAVTSEAERLLQSGYRRWQLKVGDDPVQDAERVRAVVDVVRSSNQYLSCDANCGWTPGEALRFARLAADVDLYLEQPCASIAELSQVRAGCNYPIIIDEAAIGPRALLDGIALAQVNGINLKPVRVGGLTIAARMRDIALAAGLMMVIDEPMGGMLATACIVQLAATVDPERLLAISYLGGKGGAAEAGPAATSDGPPRLRQGTVSVPLLPGIGVTPDDEALGEPVFVVEADRKGDGDRTKVAFS